MRKSIYIYIVFISALLISCEKTTDSKSSNSTGVGGSLAKFTIVGNYIYAVSSHYLYTVDISDPAKPVDVGKSELKYQPYTGNDC